MPQEHEARAEEANDIPCGNSSNSSTISQTGINEDVSSASALSVAPSSTDEISNQKVADKENSETSAALLVEFVRTNKALI